VLVLLCSTPAQITAKSLAGVRMNRGELEGIAATEHH